MKNPGYASIETNPGFPFLISIIPEILRISMKN